MSVAQRQPNRVPSADRLVTAEEFARHPEWGPCELIRGKVRPLTNPKPKHGLVSAEIAYRIGHFARTGKLGRVFTNDAGMLIERNPDTVRGPDIGFIRTERVPANLDEYLQVPYDLCVEVVSPSDAWSDVTEKVDMYLEAGVALVWVIDPQKGNAHVFRQGRETLLIASTGSLDGEDILPGFALSLADLWAAAQ
ncbi:MAG: Uma2 family endonuclease [Planctomycetes bacterium]|nr:Uma2 family endonuclease [Planctomycetota bacterium]